MNRSFRWWSGLAALGIALTVHAAAFAISPIDFSQLSDSEQTKVVAESISRRLDHAQNLKYHAAVVIKNYEFADGKLGAALGAGKKDYYTHWQW